MRGGARTGRGVGGGGGGGGRRRGGVAKAPNQSERPSLIPTPTPINHRDSDASFCSSRPSSSIGRPSTIPINDASYRSSALSAINSYLSSSLSARFTLKPPCPTTKDITETLKLILNHLGWSSSSSNSSSSSSSFTLEDDLPPLLKHLNCPIKINKSSLKTPNAPHCWPNLLPAIHWLVEICRYGDHLDSPTSNRSIFQDNRLMIYALDSYQKFIAGDDEGEDKIDQEFDLRFNHEVETASNEVMLLDERASGIEAQIEGLRSGPSAREALENERCLLEEDVKKFHSIIDGYKSGVETLEKGWKDKEKELDAKVQENKRIVVENEELKKRVELQTVNFRDAERMKREIQSIDREIGDAEAKRSKWDDKCWDLETNTSNIFKDLVSLSMECNPASRRLKVGNGFQYVLNAKGSSPDEIVGIDYKSTLKPVLNTYDADTKKNIVTKLEESAALQQQSRDYATELEANGNRGKELQSENDSTEAQMIMVKKETHDFTIRCAEEAKRMVAGIEQDRHTIDTTEREADEFLKVSSLKFPEAIKQRDEEIQMCASELLALVDLVSKYKEDTESTISEMKRDLSETAEFVANAHKGSLPNEMTLHH